HSHGSTRPREICRLAVQGPPVASRPWYRSTSRKPDSICIWFCMMAATEFTMPGLLPLCWIPPRTGSKRSCPSDDNPETIHYPNGEVLRVILITLKLIFDDETQAHDSSRASWLETWDGASDGRSDVAAGRGFLPQRSPLGCGVAGCAGRKVHRFEGMR